jgi:hypothetical protein
VINGQVARRMGVALVAEAPVSVLTTPGAEHAGAQPLPGARAVESVVPAAVGLPSVVSAAATLRLVTTPQTVHSFTAGTVRVSCRKWRR